ncbi:MAG TPA: helix-turn-helix transcriptional regulator [Planctomycetota bacterium]|jgi:transcriptional regulator with XRE-family HTH domain|nr:helix-turn-helix transcriptional regulator [Planctomycetota bacterium]
MSRFGELMKGFRASDGLTLETVARKIGSQKGYVSGIENDKVNPPSVKIIAKFHKVFSAHGMTLEDLVELAWADKAHEIIRDRVALRLSEKNPLFKVRISGAQVVVPGAAPVPAKEAV